MHSWITPNLKRLFDAEISNERYGGVSPATLGSVADSLMQAPEVMAIDWTQDDWLGLVMLLALNGPDAEVRDVERGL